MAWPAYTLALIYQSRRLLLCTEYIWHTRSGKNAVKNARVKWSDKKGGETSGKLEKFHALGLYTRARSLFFTRRMQDIPYVIPGYIIVFFLFFCLFARQVLMLEFWKRQEARLSMRWGMSEFEMVSFLFLPAVYVPAGVFFFFFPLKTRDIKLTRILWHFLFCFVRVCACHYPPKSRCIFYLVWFHDLTLEIFVL